MFRYSRNLSLPLNEDELPTPHQALLQPRTQMVKCLLSLKASTKETNAEELRWEERFALALVKNMVSRSYDELLKALASRGTQPTKCVFIKRPSMDGRMQIGSRKVVPHVAVYKLWRNPSVKQATQLTPCHPATSSCFQTIHSSNTTGANTSSASSSSAKANSLSQLQENTCINPYHYQLTVPIEITAQRKLSSQQQQALSSDANFVDSSSDDTNMEHGSLTSQNSVDLCASDEDEAAAFALQRSINLDTESETLSSSNFTPVYSLSGRKSSTTGVERSASAENFTPILSSLLTSSVCSSPGFEPTSATKICSTELQQAVVSIAETSSNILSVHDDLQLDGLEDNDLTSIHDHSVETFGESSERKDSICFFTDVKSEPNSVCSESVTRRASITSDANPVVSRISSEDSSMTITSTHPSQTVYALNGQTIQTLHQNQHHLGQPHTHHQPYDNLTSLYNFDPVISSDHHHQVYRHQYSVGVNSTGVPMVVPGTVSGSGSTVAMGSPENSQGVILQQLNNPSVTPVPASARQPQSQQQQHFSANNAGTGSCSVFYDLTSPLTPHHSTSSNTPSSNASPGASNSSGVANSQQQQNSSSITGITYEDANRGIGSVGTNNNSSSNLITLESQPLQHHSTTGSCGSSLTSSPLGGSGLGNSSTAVSVSNNNQQRQQQPAPPITSNFMQSSPPDCEFMEYEDQTPMLSNDSENQYSEIVAISSTMTQQQQPTYISGSRKTSASSFHSQGSPQPLPHSQSKYPNHGRNMGTVDTSGGMGGGFNHGYPQGNTAPAYVPHLQQPPPSHNDGSYSHHNSSKHMQTNNSSVLPLSAASHLSSNINDPTPLDDIMLQSPRAGIRTGFPVRYVQPLFWCQIRYYEFSQQIGEVCYVSPNQFSVDGGTDPSSIDRFCLGSLSNVNRQEIVEITRNNIGKGLQLFRTKNDEIYAKCLSDSPLFVQSQCCNLRYRWDPGTVCKIPPDYNLKLFTMEEFQRHLNDQLRSNSSYKSIMDLTSLCSIRISFIKGWGQEYTRKRITDVPCWIEILLNGPSQWLDRVLQRINPSSEPCDSR